LLAKALLQWQMLQQLLVLYDLQRQQHMMSLQGFCIQRCGQQMSKG
jgi:hypothetical protein